MKFILSFLVVAFLAIVNLTECNASTSQQTKEFKELMVPAEDVTLYVRIAGDPQAENILLAVHGGPGNSSDYMISLEQLQSEELTVVTYDQRGTGRSSEPDDPFGFPMMETTRDAFASTTVNTVVLNNCGHYWHECPQEAFDQIIAFLALPESN